MNYELIVCIVNAGFSELVMDAAKEVGARGGTVIRARWAGSEESEKLYGITLQQEKEVIAIVSSGEKRKNIMEAVNEKHGLSTEAGAMICSLRIDQITKLG